jgi:hypothetical protein
VINLYANIHAYLFIALILFLFSANAGSPILKMQVEGNLVLYDANGYAFWATNIYPYPGAYLLMQSNGNMVVWATSTQFVYAAHSIVIPCS